MRGSGRGAAAVLGAGVLVSVLTGCGLSWSGDDAGRLQDGIDELVSVGGPTGQAPTSVEVWGCDDPAEVPMGIARFAFDGPDDDRDVEALNAASDEVSDWYGTRWQELGWAIDPDTGAATKTFDGKTLRASVDGATSSTYTVIVSREGAGLCG